MPMYEFKCKKCGHVFERLQAMVDPCPKCPQATPDPCEGETVKLLSLGSFQLRGGGWAADGYSK